MHLLKGNDKASIQTFKAVKRCVGAWKYDKFILRCRKCSTNWKSSKNV